MTKLLHLAFELEALADRSSSPPDVVEALRRMAEILREVDSLPLPNGMVRPLHAREA